MWKNVSVWVPLFPTLFLFDNKFQGEGINTERIIFPIILLIEILKDAIRRIASREIFSKRVSLHHVKIFSKWREKIKIGQPPVKRKEAPHEKSIKSYHETGNE